MGSDQLFHKKNIRKGKEFARRKAIRSPYERVLIVCEDSKSAYCYLTDFRKYFRLNNANIIVLPSKGSAPISVVDFAIEKATNTSDIDYIVCIFDRDEHESFERAKNKLQEYKLPRNAKSKPKFMAITSIPCFEIWPLLHLTYTTKPYSSTGNKSGAENMLNELYKLLPTYDKKSSKWFSEIIDKQPTAIKNAKRLEIHNKQTNSINPSTNMHVLIEFLMNLKR